MSYTVSYERDESGWWVASVKECPGCLSQGRTIAEARQRIREALGLFIKDAATAEIVDDDTLARRYIVHVNVSSAERAADVATVALADGMDIVAGMHGHDAPTVFVRIGHGQRVKAWPKFGSWAVGFDLIGDDRNVNLPFDVPAHEILAHIRKSSTTPIDDEEALGAIRAVQAAIPWLCTFFGIPMPHDPRMERPRPQS